MRMFRLIRVAQIPDGTFGVLIDNDIPFAVTLERPWVNNERNKSCILPGTYVCKRVDSPRFGDTFEVCDVPGRSHILFHKGNIDDDTHGCILVGEQFEALGDKIAILSSAKAFKEFKMRTQDIDEFSLILSESPHLWEDG